MIDKEKAFSLLFCGKLNACKAAELSGIPVEELKVLFAEYTAARQLEDWELDTEPCWPYNT